VHYREEPGELGYRLRFWCHIGSASYGRRRGNWTLRNWPRSRRPGTACRVPQSLVVVSVWRAAGVTRAAHEGIGRAGQPGRGKGGRARVAPAPRPAR
jgi:hypothetical protein